MSGVALVRSRHVAAMVISKLQQRISNSSLLVTDRLKGVGNALKQLKSLFVLSRRFHDGEMRP